MWNTFKVTILLAAITGLFLLVGRVIGGQQGMIIAFVFALVMNGGAYWFSDKLAIAATRAKLVSPQQEPDLHRMVEELAQRANIPKPKVYIVQDPSPNAFATGRNPQHGAVAVNTGLMQLLSRDEVYGVVAHEIAHIKHRDTLTSTVVATIAGAITMLAQFAFFFGGSSDEEGGGSNILVMLLMLLLAPLAAMMIQMAVSRAREYEADKTGAELAQTPDGLANALGKLSMGVNHIPTRTDPQRASMYIVNPLRGGGFAKLFSTHPPVEDRIRRLRAMA